MERLNILKKHLNSADDSHGKKQKSQNDQLIKMNLTRSLSEWGSDLYAMAFKDVKLTERHGGDLVANVLKAHGVKFLFCLVGGHISPILVSAQKLNIRVIDVRHEVNAVFAADAVGRLTGIPGVAAVTAGPGVTNTVTAIQNCKMAQSPMVLLGGAAVTILQGRGALQDIDHMAVISPIVKWSYSCRTVRDIVPALKRAFQEAVSGVPGPVFIELPIDVLFPVLELLPQQGTHERLKASDLQGKSSKAILDRLVVPEEAKQKGIGPKEYLDSRPVNAPVFLEVEESKKPSWFVQAGFGLVKRRLHAGAHDNSLSYEPLPVHIPMPEASEITKTVALLAYAEKPLLILGSQSTLMGPEMTQSLAEAIKGLGIPCFLGGMSRGLLGRNHPLHIRQSRGGALKKCDVLIMLGITPDFRLDYGRSLPTKASIVAVNRNNQELKQNTDLFWKPTITSESDPCTFFLELSKQATSKHMWQPWSKELKEGESAKEKANSQKANEKAIGRGKLDGQNLVNPLYLCERLEEILPENSILVADGGDFVATASYIVRPRGPLRWLDPGAFGTLGVGGGFALGAKLVYPDAQVWILWGDGSCGYSLLEFDTFTRHNLPVLAIVGNDACWTQIERDQVPIFNSDVACGLDYVDYQKAAEGLGGKGFEIKSGDDDMIDKLKEAQKVVESGTSALVNVYIGKTNFREGSISI